jgi:hypothetical protein
VLGDFVKDDATSLIGRDAGGQQGRFALRQVLGEFVEDRELTLGRQVQAFEPPPDFITPVTHVPPP